MGASEWAHWLATARRVRHHPRVSRPALLDYQEERLREIVRHAARSVPIHRERFAEAGIDAERFAGRAELAALPRSLRADLKRPRRDLLAEGWDRETIHMSGTSGSTGVPAGVWRTRAEARIVRLFRARAHREIGMRSRDAVCAVLEPGMRGGSGRRDRLRALLGSGERTGISCFLPAAEIAAELERRRPDVVLGYPSSLAHVGAYLAEHGRERLAPRLVYTGGEVLDDAARARIEEGFGARVWNLYGAIEVDLVGWECAESGRFHLAEDAFVAEILDREGQPVGEGETGELVVTSLHGRTMPLLRYGLGDLVVRGPAPCPCGQPFATIESVRGRSVHYLELPDREAVHPFVVTGPLIRSESRWVAQHQMIQESLDRIVLRIVPATAPPEGALDRMEKVAHDAFGPRVDFRIDLVEAIEPGRSGKIHPYRSLLAEARGSLPDAEPRP